MVSKTLMSVFEHPIPTFGIFSVPAMVVSVAMAKAQCLPWMATCQMLERIIP